MDNHIPVLIIGAGPTGLMMGCELARHGVSFRIIDKKPERTLVSNATWIQTRTIEIFAKIGIADRFINIGHPCNAINFYIKGSLLVTMPLNYIDSIYPFVLMLPQSETERILNERLNELGGHVERPLELMDFKQDGKKVISTVRHQNGDTETITSDFLIGCGGAHSTVREKGQFLFPGKDLPEQFIVADAELESYLSKDEIHVFFDKEKIFSAFPLGSNKYRITANLHLDNPRKFFTEREVIEIVQERAHGEYYAKSVSWISPFWIHSNLVKHMHYGLVFLAGDAAHIHSPLGGQGMNTGLQDAYNLAWKLALVIKGKANPSLLDSYQTERFPIVKNIVNQTEKLTKMALYEKSFLPKLRKYCNRIACNQISVSKKMGMQLTQLDIQYQNSLIIDCSASDIQSPRPGVRAPNVIIDKNDFLYDHLLNTQHNILFFIGDELKKNQINKINAIQQWIHQSYSDLIKVHVIAKSDITDKADGIIFDKNGSIHDRYDIKKLATYIIRPDNYIAYFSKNINLTSIKNFFKQYLY